MKGSCLCGALGYEISGQPLAMYYCHCRQCRKASGSSFATNLAVAAKDFAIRYGANSLAAFESSPGKTRYFCANCGSPIYSQFSNAKHTVYVRSGTIEENPGKRPELHIHVASKAPWYEILDDLPQSKAEEDLAY